MGLIAKIDLLAKKSVVFIPDGALQMACKITASIFSPPVLAVASLAISYYLIKKKKEAADSLYIFIAVSGGIPFFLFVRGIFGGLQPIDELPYGQAVPSIHAAAISAFSLSLFHIAEKNGYGGKIFFFAMISVTAAAGAIRAYLGTEWLSGILAGYLAGAVWTGIVWLMLEKSRG